MSTKESSSTSLKQDGKPLIPILNAPSNDDFPFPFSPITTVNIAGNENSASAKFRKLRSRIFSIFIVELLSAPKVGTHFITRSKRVSLAPESTPGSAQNELGDDILKAIAAELTEKLRKNTSVDWQKRESVRARLRNLVRVTLRRHKYPPDRQEKAIELVLEQAERLADELTEE